MNTHHRPKLLCGPQQYEIMGKRQRSYHDKSPFTWQLSKHQYERDD